MTAPDSAPKIADGIGRAADAKGTPRQVLTGVAVAALVLALLGSRGLQSWADGQGGGTLGLLVGDGVGHWSGEVERLGLTAPHDALRRTIRKAENAQWAAPAE